MHICIICEILQEDSQFSDDGPICRSCVTCLVKSYGVEYTPPKKWSRMESYLSLLLAIRKQSELDKELDVFEKNWLYSSPWNQVFSAVQDAIIVSDGVSNNVDFILSQIVETWYTQSKGERYD